MPVTYDSECKAFLLTTPGMTYAMEVTPLGYLRSTHWGGVVNRAQDLAPRLLSLKETLAWNDKYDHAFSDSYNSTWQENAMLFEKQNEEIAPLSAYVFCEPGIKALFHDGTRDVVLKYHSHVIDKQENTETLAITLRDVYYPLKIELYYRIYDRLDIVDRWTVAVNEGKEDILLESLQSAAWHVPQGKEHRLSHMSGKWSGEYQIEHVWLTQSKVVLDNRSGISNHFATPWFALDYKGQAQEESGKVWFGALHWSGNWKIVAEVTQYNQTRVTGGINDFDSTWKLAANESFTTPIFTGGYSNAGFGKASRTLHDYVRDHLSPKPFASETQLPIVYNCWGVFEFDINIEQQIKLAKVAADIGCEVFMVDDGWFSTRDDDTSGLGDWWCSPTKFPNGLKPLIDAVKSYGMTFGLWVEPEMVNERSELFAKHPEWTIYFPARERTTGRNQLVLNFGRQDVQDWAIDWLDRLLTENDIDWLKWDMNRYFTEPGWPDMPGDRQREIWIRYVHGLYKVFAEVRRKHPHVKISNCASGGGRVEFGLAKYTDRQSLSDNGDGLDFQKIWWGFTQFMPPRLPGSYFNNAQANGINGRGVPFSYNLSKGFFGQMYVGSNFFKSDPEEIRQTTEAIVLYKKVRHIIAGGDMYRLVSPYENPLISVMYAAKDKNQALLLILTHSMQFYNLMPAIKLQGLDPDALYKVGDLGTYSGAGLMEKGLAFRFEADYDSRVIFIEKCG